MSEELLLAFIAVLGGGTGTALISWFTGRAKDKTEINNVAVDTADKVVTLVGAQLEELRGEIDANREERQMIMRYIDYIHDILREYRIMLPTYDEWLRGKRHDGD